MRSDLFTAFNVRCKHSIIVPPDEDGCSVCKRIDEILLHKPPFKVEALDNYHPLKKGELYTVVVVVRDGLAQTGSIPGVMLKGEEGKGVVSEVFPVAKFRFAS